jgi:hypothetical protein
LSQLSRSSGGAAGGTFVDKKFIEFLEEDLDTQGRRLLRKSPQFQKLMDDWELQKVRFRVDPRRKTRNIFISIPREISRIFRENSTQKRNFREDFTELVISQDEMILFFDPSISQTLTYIEEAANEVQSDIDGYIIVGGYGESTLLCDKIREKFAKTDSPVFVPSSPGQAVVYGATMFAHSSPISSRCIRFTYGLAISEDQSGNIVRDIFSKLVEVGTHIQAGNVITKNFYAPVTENTTTNMEISIYKTQKKNGQFVTDEGMTSVCCFSCVLERSISKVPIKIHLKFGGTEMNVECEYKGKIFKGKCNYD